MAEKITLDEIKEIIKAENVPPSDLYGVEDLTTDPVIKGFIDSTVKELKGKLSGEFYARKRVEKDGNKDKNETSEEMKKKDDEIKKLKTESAKVKATDLFSTKAKERKLDKKQIGYIERRQKKFEPEDLDNVDKEVDKFMNTTLVDNKENAEGFGHKPEKGKEDPKGGSEPGEEGSDYNDMIAD